jgi:hypothetical protein
MGRHSVLQPILLLLLLLCPGTAGADDSLQTGHRPLLLLLMGTAGEGTVESDFQMELSLWLESHRVEVLVPFAFSADTQVQRLQELRPLVEDTGAEMVLWIERMDEARFVLQVLSMAHGRAISRSAEVPAGPLSGSALAIAARELLHPMAEFRTPESDETGESPVDAGAPRPTHPVALCVGGLLTSGLVDAGAGLRVGGEVALQLQFDRGFFGTIGISGGGIVWTASGADVRGGVVAAGLGGGWLWTVKRVALGPVVRVEVPFQRVTMAVPESERQRHDFWTLRFEGALELRWHPVKRVGFFLRPGAGVSLRSKTFQREDGSVLYASGIWDWNVAVGAVFSFR